VEGPVDTLATLLTKSIGLKIGTSKEVQKLMAGSPSKNLKTRHKHGRK
jgi:hypothetical protein